MSVVFFCSPKGLLFFISHLKIKYLLCFSMTGFTFFIGKCSILGRYKHYSYIFVS